MPRLPDIDPAALDDDQRRVYDSIVSGPRGRVEGPLSIWLNSPAFAEKAQALGAFLPLWFRRCRRGFPNSPFWLTGACWKAGFEFVRHAMIALKAGLDPAAIERSAKATLPT